MAVVDWISQNQTAAAAILGTLGGLLAIIKLVSLATTIWSTVTKLQAAYQATLNAVMAANPVVLVVLAVLALAAAFVIAYKRSETFRNIVNKVAGAIAKAFGTAVAFIKNNWQKMLVILAGPVGLAVVLIVKHRDKILAAFSTAKAWVSDKWKGVKELFAGPVQKARELIGTAIDGVKNALEGAREKADTVGGKIKGFLETAFKPIDTAIGWFTTLIEKVQTLIDWLGKIKVPDIDLPGPLRTSGGSTGNGTSNLFGGRNPRTAQGAPVINITVQGAIDPDATARQIEQLLRRRGVRLGGAVAA